MTGTLFIDPGVLRTELIVEAPDNTDDGAGGLIVDWREVATIFARLEPVAARSVFGADQTLETTTHRVTLRYRDDVASGMRLRRDERVFDIVTANDPDETGRYLICRVREKGR